MSVILFFSSVHFCQLILVKQKTHFVHNLKKRRDNTKATVIVEKLHFFLCHAQNEVSVAMAQ